MFTTQQPQRRWDTKKRTGKNTTAFQPLTSTHPTPREGTPALAKPRSRNLLSLQTREMERGTLAPDCSSTRRPDKSSEPPPAPAPGSSHPPRPPKAPFYVHLSQERLAGRGAGSAAVPARAVSPVWVTFRGFICALQAHDLMHIGLASLLLTAACEKILRVPPTFSHFWVKKIQSISKEA